MYLGRQQRRHAFFRTRCANRLSLPLSEPVCGPLSFGSAGWATPGVLEMSGAMLRAGGMWKMLPSTGPSTGDTALGDSGLRVASALSNTYGGGVDGFASPVAGRVVAPDAEARAVPTLRTDSVAVVGVLGEVDSALTSSSGGAECGVVSLRAGAMAGVIDDTKADSVLWTGRLSLSGGVSPMAIAMGNDWVEGAQSADDKWMVGAAADRSVGVVGVEGFASNPSLSGDKWGWMVPCQRRVVVMMPGMLLPG